MSDEPTTPAAPVIGPEGFEVVELADLPDPEVPERMPLSEIVDPTSIVMSHDPDLQDEQNAILEARAAAAEASAAEAEPAE